MSNQEKKNENNKKYCFYLDREKSNQIQFDLDNNTTSDLLLSKYKDILTNKMDSLYKLKIEDCNFLIIETKTNMKKDDIPSLMELRVNKKTKIFNYLQNPHNNLYFLPKKKSNISDRQKARDRFYLVENGYEDVETNYFLTKPTEEYLSKAVFYLYDNDKQILTKEKGSVDKSKITILKNGNRDTIEIYIKDIIRDLYYSETSQAPYRKNLPIKGDRPKFYIEIQTNYKTYFFTQFKDNLYLQWEKAIKTAITKYNNFNLELNLNIKINAIKASLFATLHSIIDNCFSFNKILFSIEKRKMFFADFPDKKMGAIISNIILYKDLIKRNQYLDAWMRFKEILTYIEIFHNLSSKKGNENENENKIILEEDKDKINMINNINNLFTEERIKKYKEVSERADENAKKIKIEESSLFLFQNELKTALSDILKEDLFDDIFYYLFKLYVTPYFEEFKKILKEGSIPTEKPLVRQKLQFLLAIYFNKIICDMNANDFNLIYSKINSENEQIRTESMSNQINNN